MMKTAVATAGNVGDKVRSDCFVSLELTQTGGLKINLTSKVKVLYGKSIQSLCMEMLEFYGLKNATLTIDDKGALPFVISARLESAIKQLVRTDKEFLPEFLPENGYSTSRDQHRFTRLYLPGNSPAFMVNAGIHAPDAIILDLEDSVSFDRKFEARFLVRNALRNVSFLGVERMVRINQVPGGLDDLDYIIPHNANLVLIPKCENADQVAQVNDRIQAIQLRTGQTNPVWLMPIIESAMGVMKSFEIAQAAENVVALSVGLEDYTADIGARRTNEGHESLFARCQVLTACKAVGIQAIDSVFSDIGDMEALKENVLRSKALGFDGMGCIHPRQIKVIRDHYAPDDLEIETAEKIVTAFLIAKGKGLGVVSLGNKMIDPPVVKKARRTIDLAISLGKRDSNWRQQMISSLSEE